MTWRARLFLLVACLVTSAVPYLFAQDNDERCLRYGEDVSILGALERRTFPGRPNFTSVAAGDEAETGFYLIPASPLCVAADLSYPDAPGLHGVNLVQLILDSTGYAQLRPSVGWNVLLHGYLMAAWTGHHHAPLLLSVVRQDTAGFQLETVSPTPGAPPQPDYPTYYGTVTNQSHTRGEVSAGLTLLITDGGHSAYAGNIQIETPLGGSGSARFWAWGDSILAVSISLTGDTIAWAGRKDGTGFGGRYVIPGGTYAGQGGKWRVSLTSSRGVRPDKAPSVTLRNWIGEQLRLRDRLMLPAPPAAATPTLPTQSEPNRPAVRRPPTPRGADSQLEDRFALALLVFGVTAAIVVYIRYSSERPPEDVPVPSPPPPTPPQGKRGGYAINCPFCEQARITEARKLWFVQGLVFAIRYGEQTIVGCHACVVQKGLEALGRNLLLGWWSVLGVVATPLVLLQNVVALGAPASPDDVEELLRHGGIDPDAVRLDDEGFTREQRRLLEAATYVLATAIWADGHAAPEEYARALQILQQFSSGLITPERASELINSGRHGEPPSLRDLPADMRDTLLRMALDIALADGHLGLPEIAMLHSMADRLGILPGVVEQLIDDFVGASRARQQTHARGGGGSEHRRTKADDHGARQPRRGSEDLARARSVLQVSVTASMFEIKRAYREAVLQHHPDRSGANKERQAEATSRTQELNWAYSALKRAAEAEMHAT